MLKEKIIIISCFCWAKQTDHKVNLDFQEKCALHHLLKIFIKLECCLFSYSSYKCSLTIKFDKFLTQLNNYDKIASLCVPSALIIYCYHLWQFISLDLLWPDHPPRSLPTLELLKLKNLFRKAHPNLFLRYWDFSWQYPFSSGGNRKLTD